jgi:tetratricopeptide (TPR) repeat protein
MLGEALRATAGIAAADGPDERHRKLRARLGRHLRGETLGHALGFLGELIGAPPGEPDAALIAAREDAQRMGAEVVAAWEALLAAESRHTPLVIILDDLHWGDLATIKLLDEAMRDPERPLAVLAFARPEVRELFPGLFAERGVLELRLTPLGKRAAGELVRAMLPALDEETTRRVVDRAGGNAFFLEELIRAVSEGRGEALPDTVLAMAHARIEGFESEARRVLRAASIFGETFWRTGVTSLLGASGRSLAVGDWLELLCEREMITRRPEPRFAGEAEYVFRHALVREAAYATLPDEDRRRGHRLAGEWLGGVGERDAVVLGQHFERGGDAERAIRWYHKAAQQAMEGLDPGQAVARAEKAIALGAADATLGALEVILCEAHHSRGDITEAERRALSALDLLERGSPAWYRAATILFALAAFGNVTHLFEVVARVEAAAAGGEPSVARQQTWSIAAAMLFAIGQIDRARAFIARVEADAEAAAKNPMAEVWLRVARMYGALYLERSPGAFLDEVGAALAVIERIGDTQADVWLRVEWAGALIAAGAIERGVAVLEELLATTQATVVLRASVLHYLTRGYGLLGRLDEALRVQEEALVASRAQKSLVYVALGLVHRSRLLLHKGDAPAARRDAAEAGELLAFVPTVRPAALAAEAAAALALGHAAEALALAREAHAAFAGGGMNGEAESPVRLILAEALHATGDLPGARRAIADARARLFERAATLEEEALRQAFLTRLPEHARTLELAAAWLAAEEDKGGGGPETAPTAPVTSGPSPLPG